MNFQPWPPQDVLEPIGYLTALSRLIVDGTVSRKNPKPAPGAPIARMTRLGWRPLGIHSSQYGTKSCVAFIYVDPTTPEVPSRERTLIFHNTRGLEFAFSRGGLTLPIPSSAYERAGMIPPPHPTEFALSKEDRDAVDWCTTILNPR
jgi:hypothetical protein